MPKCRIVGRLGVGLDNIDSVECGLRSIKVIPANGANALSVAEYVVTTALLLLRGSYLSSSLVAQGHWPRNALSKGREIQGKTIGLIGFGSIGQLTAQLAKNLGMKVVAFDKEMTASDPVFDELKVSFVELDALLAMSDVVSLHIPLLPSTKGLFDAKRLSLMKRNSILINTSRGGIIDEPALATALKETRLGGAALDVFDIEPLLASTHFMDCPNLVLTPHIAGVTEESNIRVSSLIADKVLEALQ
jgi:(S)-sulfolactate dehydrogenase